MLLGLFDFLGRCLLHNIQLPQTMAGGVLAELGGNDTYDAGGVSLSAREQMSGEDAFRYDWFNKWTHNERLSSRLRPTRCPRGNSR